MIILARASALKKTNTQENAKSEGKIERSKEIATNLVKLGIAIDTIMQATDLSQQDILALKTENANT